MQKSAHFPPFPSLSFPLQTRDGKILDTTYIFRRVFRCSIHFPLRDKNFSLSKVYRNISRKSRTNPRERIPRIILVVLSRSEFTRERERGGNVKKPCSVKSKLRTSSILKSETKSSRLPTYLENVHLPSRLSPSAFDESRLDFRLGQDFFPVQGSRAAIQGWKNRADGLDGCRFS